MLRNLLLTLALAGITPVVWAQTNALPVVSNITAVADTVNKKVTFTYDLADADNNQLEVSLRISGNDGLTFNVPIQNVSGDAGFPVTPGAGKQLVWSYKPEHLYPSTGTSFVAKIVADDREVIDIQAIVNQVDSVRLRNELVYLTSGVRHAVTGLAKLNETKEYIAEQFMQGGLDVRRDSVMQIGAYKAENIIGRKQGTTDDGSVIIIDGHFDSVSGSRGADDNGSAVVGTLEALRILSPYTFKKTLKFVGFDQEESGADGFGLKGSFHFVQNARPDYEKIEGVMNLEMIGYYSETPNSQKFPFGFSGLFPDAAAIVEADQNRGNFIVNVGNTQSLPFQAAFNTACSTYVPQLKVVSLEVYPDIYALAGDLLRSDHAPFWLDENPSPALMLTDGANFRNLNYHTAKDTVESLNFTFMSNVVKGVVATALTLGGVQHAGWDESQPFELTKAPEEPLSRAETNLTQDGFKTFPNAFETELNIQFNLKKNANVAVRVIDLQGRLIQEWKNKKYNAGENTLVWKVENVLSEGFYMIQIQTDTEVLTRKLLYLEGHNHQH